jgi:hypothetical protein
MSLKGSVSSRPGKSKGHPLSLGSYGGTSCAALCRFANSDLEAARTGLGVIRSLGRFRLRSKATAGQVGATRDRRTLPHAGLAQITRPPKNCQGGRRYRQNDRKCKGSEKMRGHKVINTGRYVGTFSTGVGCGWNRNTRRKYLIFRGLAAFFTIFHPFFTPYFSQKTLVFRILCKTHGYKRRKQFKCRVENAKINHGPAATGASTAGGHRWTRIAKQEGILNPGKVN